MIHDHCVGANNKQNAIQKRKKKKTTIDPDEANLPVILTFGPQSWEHFQQLEIPQPNLLKTARYFVFNKLGVYVGCTPSTNYTKKTLSYYCKCEAQYKWLD